MYFLSIMCVVSFISAVWFGLSPNIPPPQNSYNIHCFKLFDNSAFSFYQDPENVEIKEGQFANPVNTRWSFTKKQVRLTMHL